MSKFKQCRTIIRLPQTLQYQFMQSKNDGGFDPFPN